MVDFRNLYRTSDVTAAGIDYVSLGRPAASAERHRRAVSSVDADEAPAADLPAPPATFRGIPHDVHLFEVFWEQIQRLMQARTDLSMQDISALLLSLLNLSLNCYPDRLEYVDQVLGFAREKLSEALEAGVDVVCPLGGDGTIRAVAVALAGTRTPMGLLPRGTGNLLARNLDIPVAGDLTEALRVACSGRNKAIDVAWLELDPAEEAATDDSGQAEEPVEGPPVDRHPFLVMAGMGFDAAIMGNTSEELKARVGWTAYFVTGFRSIFIKRFRVRWTIDGQAQEPVRARTILFGNCGTLTGGIQLIPSARLDDGLVDGIVVAPKTLVGWGSIAVRVLGRSDKAGQELIRTSGAEYTAVVDEPHPVQVDGDVIGEASRLRVTVDRQALVVRVSGV